MLVYTVQHEDTSRRHFRRPPAPLLADCLLLGKGLPVAPSAALRPNHRHRRRHKRLTFVAVALRYHPVEGRTVVLYC